MATSAKIMVYTTPVLVFSGSGNVVFRAPVNGVMWLGGPNVTVNDGFELLGPPGVDGLALDVDSDEEIYAIFNSANGAALHVLHTR